MRESLKLETQRLAKSWMRHDRNMLRDYLVRDVEDPRINVQSILTRHFLIERLFGERFAWLGQQELRFALVVNWLLRLLKTSVAAWQLQALLDSLLTGRDNAGGLRIPSYVSQTFADLRLPKRRFQSCAASPGGTFVPDSSTCTPAASRSSRQSAILIGIRLAWSEQGRSSNATAPEYRLFTLMSF